MFILKTLKVYIYKKWGLFPFFFKFTKLQYCELQLPCHPIHSWKQLNQAYKIGTKEEEDQQGGDRFLAFQEAIEAS